MNNPNRITMLAVTVVVLTLSNTVYAEDFGRLFTTPKERQLLDKQRQQQTQQPTIELVEERQFDEEIQEAESILDPISIKGIVKRSGKTATVWVNESNTNEADFALSPLRVNRNVENNAVVIEMPGADEAVKLKVGQTYDPQSGNIIDINPMAPANN